MRNGAQSLLKRRPQPSAETVKGKAATVGLFDDYADITLRRAMEARGYIVRNKNESVVNIEKSDAELLVKALRDYRPETTEEEGIKFFYIDQFEKLK